MKIKLLFLSLIFILVSVFFKDFIIHNKLPIPSDTIVGLYYPFRDSYFKTNPNGLPYKNFLVTDPVRQQYPWKYLSIDQIKSLNIPLWNPYNFSGTPLLANFQSAVFYPFNFLFFIIPFHISWSILIFIQPLLAGIFMFFYLNNLKLNKTASFLGSLSFSFSGFFIAWLEWGIILHTALWLPLILLSIDKILSLFQNDNFKFQISNFKFLGWNLVFLLTLVFSFFAGHLQTFFYLAIFSIVYFIARFIQDGKKRKTFGLFLVLGFLFIIITSVQWYPTLKFINLSARNLDLAGFREAGWFIPWQNLIQFIAPDFFGNPSTLNYYGVWNYAEFIGYIGIFPLILSFYALFFRRDKKTLFFSVIFFASLIFALPTIFAKIPFKFEIPFISTSQPTRLLFPIVFSLSSLASFGLDYFIKVKNRKLVFFVLILLSLFFASLWVFVSVFGGNILSAENLLVARQNLILPTALFILVSLFFLIPIFIKKEKILNVNLFNFSLFILFLITIFDLFRFGWKFEPFTNKEYLYPSTEITSFLQKQEQPFRVLSVDSRILPPNFSIMYKIQVLDGYDPLYLQRYGELMAASGRGRPDISAPFGFNRIITPQDPLSRINDFLGAKYVLSLKELNINKLNLVFSDGTIYVYENSRAFKRVFFVNNTLIANSKQEAIETLFEVNYPLNSRAVVEEVTDKKPFKNNWSIGSVKIISYQDNNIILETQNSDDGFLVLTDSFYPSWKANIDGKETKIYLTDFNFKGIIVPKGIHNVEFYTSLF